jgi:hypothetical protein
MVEIAAHLVDHVIPPVPVRALTLTGIDPPLLTKTDPPVGVLGKRTQLT